MKGRGERSSSVGGASALLPDSERTTTPMILCVRRLQPAAHGTGIQNFVGSALFTDFQRSGPFMRRRTDVLQNHRSGPGSRVCSETFGPELKNREPSKEPNDSLRNGPSAVLDPPEAPRTGSEGSGRVVLDFGLQTSNPEKFRSASCDASFKVSFNGRPARFCRNPVGSVSSWTRSDDIIQDEEYFPTA